MQGHRWVAAIVASLALVTGTARAAVQTVNGSFLVACANTPAVTRVGYPNAQGVCGYRFNVNAATIGSVFRLHPGDPASDLEIWFYKPDGACGELPKAGCLAHWYSGSGSGDVTGTVPSGATYAVVVADVQTDNPGTATPDADMMISFTYSA